MQQFDVAVLGGGPGGYVCAIRCAQYGLKTVLIEGRDLGGTCLNRGCIPTKAMLHSAEVYQEVCEASKFGISASDISYDFSAIAARRDKIIQQLRNGIKGLESSYGVALISGKGVLTGPNTIQVGDETIEAKKIVLATGAEPSLPPIPGIDGQNVLTSDDVLQLSACPESLVIIGGGVIGMEFATLFSSLGKSVTVLEMMPSILPGVDSEITKLLIRKLKKQKVEIKTSVKVQKITGGATVSVEYEEKGAVKSATGACCVVCAGRRPMTKDLGLEKLGVTMNRGFVQVDDQLKTNVPSLLAIGDITGKIQLAHVASAQGLVAAATCAGKKDKMSYDVVPACIYTSPEIAYVGKTEDAAKADGKKVQCGSFNVMGNGKSMVMGADTGLIKIVTDAETGEILGAQLMGPRATDMIAEICAVMKSEGTIEELASTIHPHPTVSETIMEAAHSAMGLCCNAPPAK